MELYFYLGLAVLTIIFSLRHEFISSKILFRTFWISVYISLALVVRANFDADINTYASEMSHSSLTLYYLKEPFFWLGQRFLFNLLQDPFFVFLITDLLVGFLLFRALINFELPQYAFFSILIFFPFVLGMQNVYRQWVATIIFLYGFSLSWSRSGNVKSYAAFLLSIMSHNVAAIFGPLFFVRNAKVVGKLGWYISFLVAIVGVWIGADTKSSADTGADLALFYVFLISIFILIIPIVDRGFIRKIRNVEYNMVVFLFLISSVSFIFLSSAGSERVSMFCLLVVYPILVQLLESRFKNKFPMRALLSLLGFIPMLLFSVSKFILST